MTYSQILLQTERAISNYVDIVAVMRVDKINVTDESRDVIHGKVTPPGEYGVVDMRLMIPIKKSV